MHAREQSTGTEHQSGFTATSSLSWLFPHFVSAGPFGFVGLTHTEARHQHNILVDPYITVSIYGHNWGYQEEGPAAKGRL